MPHNEFKNLIFSGRGTVPIILTAAHGDHLDIPGLSVRKSGTLEKDIGTAEIAQELSIHLKDLLRQTPYVVIAEFHRRYIDVNRSEPRAFDTRW